MLGVVKTRTIHGHCAKKNGTSFSGPAASIVFSISSWLRGVDLSHRPLGYEPNELPDCSTPHFDHKQWLRHRQTYSASALRQYRRTNSREAVYTVRDRSEEQTSEL